MGKPYKKELEVSFFKKEPVVLKREVCSETLDDLNSAEMRFVKEILGREEDLSGSVMDVDSCTTQNGEYIDHDSYQVFIGNRNKILEVISA